MYRRIRKNISFFVFFQEQRIFFCKSTSRLISSHWPDVGYVPIVYKSLPRWMKLPLASGAGLRWASLEVRGCMGKCYAKMKVMLELGTGCMLAGTSHAQFCCCSVAQSCPTLCDPMDCSTPGFPVLHYLPEFAQTHVHWVSDAIQPSPPLLPLVFYRHPNVHERVKENLHMSQCPELRPKDVNFDRWMTRIGVLVVECIPNRGKSKCKVKEP